MATLTSCTGGRPGEAWSLDPQRENLIGRLPSEDLDIPLADPSSFVSRRHAIVWLEDDVWFLRDVSTNGTLVNGARVADRRALRDGDVLAIGPHELCFEGPDGGGVQTVRVVGEHPPSPIGGLLTHQQFDALSLTVESVEQGVVITRPISAIGRLLGVTTADVRYLLGKTRGVFQLCTGDEVVPESAQTFDSLAFAAVRLGVISGDGSMPREQRLLLDSLERLGAEGGILGGGTPARLVDRLFLMCDWSIPYDIIGATPADADFDNRDARARSQVLHRLLARAADALGVATDDPLTPDALSALAEAHARIPRPGTEVG